MDGGTRTGINGHGCNGALNCQIADGRELLFLARLSHTPILPANAFSSTSLQLIIY